MDMRYFFRSRSAYKLSISDEALFNQLFSKTYDATQPINITKDKAA